MKEQVVIQFDTGLFQHKQCIWTYYIQLWIGIQIKQVQLVTESYVSHKILTVVSIVEFHLNNGKNSMLTTK